MGDEQRRVLVRLARPTVVPRAAPKSVHEPPKPVRIGAAGAGPLEALVTTLAAAPATAEGRRLSRFDTVGWPVFAGAGLLPSASPLSAGWLVPAGPLGPNGWLGPARLAGLDAPAGLGLVVLATRLLPGQEPEERGAWVVAEAALDAGWGWALLALQPLAREERTLVGTRLARWAGDPVREARRLVRVDPALAAKLALWTVPTTEPPPNRLGVATAGALAVVALLATLLELRGILARRAA